MADAGRHRLKENEMRDKAKRQNYTHLSTERATSPFGVLYGGRREGTTKKRAKPVVK